MPEGSAHCGCWKLNSGPLGVALDLLTVEPSLQLLTYRFYSWLSELWIPPSTCCGEIVTALSWEQAQLRRLSATKSWSQRTARKRRKGCSVKQESWVASSPWIQGQEGMSLLLFSESLICSTLLDLVVIIESFKLKWWPPLAHPWLHLMFLGLVVFSPSLPTSFFLSSSPSFLFFKKKYYFILLYNCTFIRLLLLC